MKNMFNEAAIANTEEVKGGTFSKKGSSKSSATIVVVSQPKVTAPVYVAPVPVYDASIYSVYGKGANGANGADGAKGADGAAGANGADGGSFGGSNKGGVKLTYKWSAAKGCYCWC
jgi:hypothetical protein